ncbi:AraC-like DNA-binding protein [Chitinophaga skermanii]|uniref:AraC-like DNA-binding protein n=1 Tax=Chitinophaga skermanii TaxID=331697 RepID=A0A327R537_9BACT|nr:helix-turn-helix domain-containing protein [Chitinophaga skermanii]RAJ10874.1 AraC-like DNA-binding protein [Chitinophaga skermanii]
MNFMQQIVSFVSLLGAFNGLVLSTYLLVSKRTHSLAARLLGVLLLMISIRVAKSVFLYFNPQMPKVYAQIGLSACLFIGPALYYFYRAAMQQKTSIPKSWQLTWACLIVSMLAINIFLPYDTNRAFWNNGVIQVIYLVWAGFILASGVVLWPVMKTFFTRSRPLQATEQFWLLLFLANLAVKVVYDLSMYNLVAIRYYISGAIMFTFLLYLTLFFYFQRASIGNILSGGEANQAKGNGKKKIDEVAASGLKEKLFHLLATQGIHKDPNLKISEVAKLMNISSHQLSQFLNDNLQKSFTTFMNEYRVEEACKLIAQDDRLTFEAIGYEVGFNSKSTFYAAFKKMTGATPAGFKEQANKL